MNKSDIIRIIKRIEFIKSEIQDLKKFKEITYEEYKANRDVQRIIERIVENIANAIIDIVKIILANMNIPIPDTYRDIILSLKETEMIDSSLAESLANLAKIRNILAHQYLDIKWILIEGFLKESLSTVEVFIEKLEKSSLLSQDDDL